jgi:hypothetical protein
LRLDKLDHRGICCPPYKSRAVLGSLVDVIQESIINYEINYMPPHPIFGRERSYIIGMNSGELAESIFRVASKLKKPVFVSTDLKYYEASMSHALRRLGVFQLF